MTQVTDVGFAACLFYVGFTLTSLTANPSTFTFDADENEVNELFAQWNSPEGLPLTSGRHYTEAQRQINSFRSRARVDAHGQWINPRYLGLEK